MSGPKEVPTPNQPDRNIPAKPDENPDPTRQVPERNDPTHNPNPDKTEPTRVHPLPGQ